MKKLCVLASMMMLSLGVFAQHEVGTLTLQPKVGVNIANMSKYDDADSRIGFAVGGEFEYQATPIVSLSAGMLYSQQGVKYDVANTTSTIKTDYINVPVLANFYVVKGLALKVGVQPGFNVLSKIKIDNGNTSVSRDIDNTNSFDFAIPVGLSYEYENIVFDGRYNIGMTKAFDGGDAKHNVFQITVGYKFAL